MSPTSPGSPGTISEGSKAACGCGNVSSACLDKLGNRVSGDDRKRIVAALVKKAGEPPTKAERIAAHRRSAKFFAENSGTDDRQYKAHRAALEALGDC
jgi:hypothetical protein